jgi:D12 class N6 adenine-specific DNA methyltransferase
VQYFGGKSRVASAIASYLESVRDNRPYLEPFVGGASVMCRMTGDRVGGDRIVLRKENDRQRKNATTHHGETHERLAPVARIFGSWPSRHVHGELFQETG